MTRDEETTEQPGEGDGDDDRALDQRLTEYMKLGVPAATLACAAAAGYAQGPAAVVLVLAGGALIGVIAIFWASIRTLVGETPLSGADAYALGAPRAEEEQKRAVLRALKDLEFERSVGKISEEDYQALVTKYRAEAKRLLRVLDEASQPERQKVETILRARLAREGLAEAAPAEAAGKAPANEPPKEKKAKKGRKAGKPAPEAAPKQDEAGEGDASEVDARKPAGDTPTATKKCAACGTANDADAVFCKKCGARQNAPAQDEGDEGGDTGETAAKEGSS